MTRRLPPLIPPIVLCIVATVQVYLVHTYDLSPWKGGGFGMFSTLDDQFRQVDVQIEEPGGWREIDIERDHSVARAAVFPTRGGLRSLAEKIGRNIRARGASVSRIRVSVSRLEYAEQTFEPRLVLIREVEVDLDRPDRR